MPLIGLSGEVPVPKQANLLLFEFPNRRFRVIEFENVEQTNRAGLSPYGFVISQTLPKFQKNGTAGGFDNVPNDFAERKERSANAYVVPCDG